MPEQARSCHGAASRTRPRQRSHGAPQLPQAGDPPVGYAEVDPTGRYGRYDEVLGKGSAKTVYRGFDEWQGIEVAWNQVRLHDFLRSAGGGGDLDRLYGEVRLLAALRHRALMRLHAAWVDPRRRTLNFLTELFSSGTLRQYREKHRVVSMAAVRRWSRQILEGLAYLQGHSPPVVHGDLSCANIFVNGHKGEAKIGDLGLGLAAFRTPEFMAPEVYGGEDYVDGRADVYSFGMCVLEMLTLEFPYAECSSSPLQIYNKAMAGIRPEALYKVRDPAARRFIDRCLAPASRRPAARELLHDRFLQIGGSFSDPGDVVHDYYHPLHRQPSFQEEYQHQHHADSNGGSTPSNGLSKSINGEEEEDTLSADRSYCDDEGEDDGGESARYHGVELLFDEHEVDCNGDDVGGGVEMKIKGRRMEDGGIFLRLRIADRSGLVRSIYFPFDVGADTAQSVAAEMAGELDIVTGHEVAHIAGIIDAEVGALVPEWAAAGPASPGMDGAPDAPCCDNCRPSSYGGGGGSLLEFMSSAGHRGCRCAGLHGRFEEITSQPADQ